MPASHKQDERMVEPSTDGRPASEDLAPKTASSGSRWATVLFWTVGTAVFALAGCFAELSAWLNQPEGRIYSPVQAQKVTIGDAYYYLTWVREFSTSGPDMGSATADELEDEPTLEDARWVPLAVAGAGRLVSSDIRMVYVVSRALSGAMYFIFPALLAMQLVRSRAAGALAAVATYFYTHPWWQLVTVHARNPRQGTLEWLSGAGERFLEPFQRWCDVAHLELLDSTFRYVHVSISGPLFIAAACVLVWYLHKPSLPRAIMVFVATLAMAFCYPAHLVIFGGVAGLAAIYLFCFRSRRGGVMLLGAGLAAGAVLLATGYAQMLRETYTQVAVWTYIFGDQQWQLRSGPVWHMVRIVLLNKYTLVGVGLLAVTAATNRKALVFVGPVVAMTCLLCGLFVLDISSFRGRFFVRGIDLYWMPVLAATVAAAWGKWVARPVAGLTRWRVDWVVAGAAIAVLAGVPLTQLAEYGLAPGAMRSRSISEHRWEGLQWLDAHAERHHAVGALDWTDITLIPIYSDANVVAGHFVIDGRTPSEEIRRYAAVWKAVGLSRDEFLRRFDRSVAATNQRDVAIRQRLLDPPLLSDEDHAAGQLFESLIYGRYVRKVGGIVVTEDRKQLTPEFRQHVVELYDEASLDDGDIRCDFIMLSGLERQMDHHVPAGYEQVFSNQTHVIYARQGQLGDG